MVKEGEIEIPIVQQEELETDRACAYPQWY
jgi:hypothetical protein